MNKLGTVTSGNRVATQPGESSELGRGLPQMVLALIYPIILGLDRLATAALLRANGTFQYPTGLPCYPDSQTLRRFLLQAPPDFREQLHIFNDWLLQQFILWPEHRSRLILDLDSTVLTVFGRREGAAVGYNPGYRGKRSYCLIRWIDYRVPSPRPSPIRWERVPAGRVRAMVYSIPRTPHYFQGRSFPRNMPTIIPQHKAIRVA